MAASDSPHLSSQQVVWIRKLAPSQPEGQPPHRVAETLLRRPKPVLSYGTDACGSALGRPGRIPCRRQVRRSTSRLVPQAQDVGTFAWGGCGPQVAP